MEQIVNEVILINSKEQLLEMFREIASEMMEQEKDTRLFATPKEFAEEIGVTNSFFETYIKPQPDFDKCIVKIERKHYIKREIGRDVAMKIMNKYRR